MSWKKNNGVLALMLAGWGCLLAGGIWAMEREEFTPVTPVKIGADFPKGSQLRLASSGSTLIVFAHPKCPCTRATLHELSEILATPKNGLHPMIVFTLPPGVPAGWEKGDLLDLARRVPNLVIAMDRNGEEARRFGVKGSRHALVYSAEGRLLFSGGITGSRGHEGDNPGSNAVIALGLNENPSVTRTPVFGCSLL